MARRTKGKKGKKESRVGRVKRARDYVVRNTSRKKKRKTSNYQLNSGSSALENELKRIYNKGYGTSNSELKSNIQTGLQKVSKKTAEQDKKQVLEQRQRKREEKIPQLSKQTDKEEEKQETEEPMEERIRHGQGYDLEITPLNTTKDKIKQPELSEDLVIPRINDCILMNGRTGAGKTTLLANLITKKQFFKNKFDRVFLVSPTGESDDIQKDLGIPKEDVITDPDEAPEFIEILMQSQTEQIKELGAHKAPLYALIYDDCIGYQDLLKDPTVQKSFYACRHYNFTTFMLTQSFTKVPRACRLQARSIFYFAGSNSEAELMSEEFAPPGYDRKAFKKLLGDATKEGYDFLHIQLRSPVKERFRHCLGEIIPIHESEEEIKDTLSKPCNIGETTPSSSSSSDNGEIKKKKKPRTRKTKNNEKKI